jgi:hypothetical protein
LIVNEQSMLSRICQTYRRFLMWMIFSSFG